MIQQYWPSHDWRAIIARGLVDNRKIAGRSHVQIFLCIFFFFFVNEKLNSLISIVFQL